MTSTEQTRCENADLLADLSESANALMDCHLFLMFVAKLERARNIEHGHDFELVRTDEAQEILQRVISKLTEYQEIHFECRRCRETKQLKA